jgi:hypothetical protein
MLNTMMGIDSLQTIKSFKKGTGMAILKIFRVQKVLLNAVDFFTDSY